ncbi:amp dependent CoA ligase [Dichomitus squalens]|uniref:Amp dependent CoA ligase n=2 Tax=Dichomitus squalens TaxID=114155 RepID=A0A4Q9Q7Q0_9APHY|nr:amp dependent CoA ligase [Dichomitus squalens LYAD-421 SS1]EJF61698.1 amp dependent CoA ligase [Dichomitus squalens LYAD-421 SS1]TBU41204.1 amp dependent CoA ligase [Dichomitus squalens]TBU63557.1 amp dependent CoA ligase [Dichomitus squalens]
MTTQNIPTIYGVGGPVARIPDDVTIPQFFFDQHHELNGEALHLRQPTYFIDDATGRHVTGDEVRARVLGLANALHIRWNIGDGDVVCIYGPNHVDYSTVIWATHRVGGIVTGANPAYTAEELVYQIQTAKATVLFVHPDALPVGLEAARATGIRDDRIVVFDAVPGDNHLTVTDLVKEGLLQPKRYVEPRLKPGEGRTKIALLCFSSGTTGRAKAVMIPHYAVIANCIQMKQYANTRDAPYPNEKKLYRSGDVAIAVLPFYHIYGVVVNLHYYLFCGMTLVLVQKFNFENMLKSVQRYKIGHMTLVPPMVVLLCKHPAVKNYDLSSVKLLTCGAAPLSAELTHQVAKLLPHAHIGQGYGMTETCTTVSFPQLDMRIGTPGSAGRLIPGTAVRILKADGSWGGVGETGQLVVSAPSVTIGYLNNEEATRETFKDGWVYTGDEGYVNEKKELFIIDRIKELIKVRGFQVAPAELEGHLLDHPDVADVCVVAAPDDYSGELPFAFVALHERVRAQVAADPREAERVRQSILKHVADHKTQYKWLAGVEFIDVVPKNPSGKLLRRVLRDRLKEGLQAGRIKLVQPKERAKL